jgi:hypothetical protein
LEQVFDSAKWYAAEDLPLQFGIVMYRRAVLCDGAEVKTKSNGWLPSSFTGQGEDVWKVGTRIIRLRNIVVNVKTPGVFQFYFGDVNVEKAFNQPGLYPIETPWTGWTGEGELKIGWTSTTGALFEVGSFPDTSYPSALSQISIGSGISYEIIAECAWLPIICRYKERFERALRLKTASALLDTAIQSTMHVESSMLKQDPKRLAKEALDLEYRKELETIALSLKLDCCDECIKKNSRVQYKTTY